MSRESEDEIPTDVLGNAAEVVDGLEKELDELYRYKDLFFDNHPLELANEKTKFVDQKKNLLLDKFEKIDADTQIPVSLRAQFLHLKGRCYNISPAYDARAIRCLSKAVKLNPHLVDAWNGLGECYWQNMNVKDAKASFEGALKYERNSHSLRCLSIVVRQESGPNTRGESTSKIFKSVELAKEAVALDPKDGVSWTILGNAYLCQFFMVDQYPSTLKACLSAYKQAKAHPIAKGQPDLYYNWGIALQYEECYDEALQSFDYACRLDPLWGPPKLGLNVLQQYVNGTNDLVQTKGKIKAKKLQQMVQSIDKKMLAHYGPDMAHTVGFIKKVTFEQVRLDALQEGENEGKVLLGRVVGSIHSEGAMPFTFALVDESMQCVCVTVYNWAAGRGAIIGDCVAVPKPRLTTHQLKSPLATYNFKSIRVNNPMTLVVNGKRVGHDQYASIRVTSTYQTFT